MRKPLPIAAFVLILIISGCNSAADGRRGNDLYASEAYPEATVAYQDGLVSLVDDTDSPLRTRYFNNLGASLYRQGEHQSAQEAFVQSAAAAADDAERSRASYNAGNNAYRMDDKKLSSDFFIQALVADPTSVDAKMNYEFVKRQLEQEQEENGGGQDEPPEPSEYAKELKAQAEALVAQQRYREAFRLMDEGRQVDPTVEAFASFIDRIAAVADINEMPL